MSMYRVYGRAGQAAVDRSEGIAEQSLSRVAARAGLRVAISLPVLAV